jgi:hypothetical protein
MLKALYSKLVSMIIPIEINLMVILWYLEDSPTGMSQGSLIQELICHSVLNAPAQRQDTQLLDQR